jgi:hypothetical protein
MVKKIFLATIVAISSILNVYSQEYYFDDEDQAPDTISWTQDGFQSAHSAMNAMGDRFGLRYDVSYLDDGTIEGVTTRGGLYLSPRVGFEYSYVFGSKTNYPALVGELGIGYRTKRLDARFFAGVASARYGKFSDKEGKYISPRLSVEVLYEVCHDHAYEENSFKIGAELNYHLRRAYAIDKDYKFSFVGSYPGVAAILEYERQFWGSRSSLTVGLKVGTEYEPGNGKQAWGVCGGVYVAYRIGLQKKNVYASSVDIR